MTESVDPKKIHLAIEMLKLHMVGAHKEDQNDAKELNSKQQYDPNESRTCSYCYKMFFNKYAMKNHVKTQWNGKVQLWHM